MIYIRIDISIFIGKTSKILLEVKLPHDPVCRRLVGIEKSTYQNNVKKNIFEFINNNFFIKHRFALLLYFLN